MARQAELMLIDGGAETMDVLAARLGRLNCRTLRAKTTEEAHRLLVDPRYQVDAAVIPADLPVLSLKGAVSALRALSRDRSLTFLVTGERPFSQRRREIAQAGVALALWEPVDAHTLRFQVNRALCGGRPLRAMRRAERAPAPWPVRVEVGRRIKEARVYSISASGAYLTTPSPSLRHTPLHFSLPLPEGDLALRGRVVTTNVPGNLFQPNLPVGMAVRFEDTDPRAEAMLQLYAEERLRALAL